jgi:hypothetical protein
MTSQKLAEALLSAGVKLSADSIRRAWAQGAPRNSAAAFIRWRDHRQKKNPVSAKTQALRDDKVGRQIAILDAQLEATRLETQARRGELIRRSDVAERMQRAAGELNAYRVNSEAEHAMLFSAAAGDVAQCRSVLRGIWDDIMRSIQGLSKHFAE